MSRSTERGAAGGELEPPSSCSPPYVARRWQNWARIETCYPRDTFRPSSERELCDVVAALVAARRRFRVVGSGHSPSDIACSNSAHVSLERYAQPLSLDKTRRLVTVQAGMRIDALNAYLDEHALALPSLGSISEQTIAGALATATHGTGVDYGILGTLVRRMRIVVLRDVDGAHDEKKKTTTATTNNNNNDDDDDDERVIGGALDARVVECSRDTRASLFSAACCHLGVVGVLSTVTLEVCDAFDLAATSEPATLDDVLARLDTLRASAPHVRFWWFPHTDRCVLWRAARLPPDATQRTPAHRTRLSAALDWLRTRLFGFYVLEALLFVALWLPALTPLLNWCYWALLFSWRSTVRDRSHRVFNFDCLFRQYVSEWCVPIDRTAAAMRGLRTLVADARLNVHWPVEVRFTAADDVWLSNCHAQPSAWIGIIAYRPYGVEPAWWRFYFLQFERLMSSSAIAGRPHWAKRFDWGGTRQAAAAYPHWHEFWRVADAVDPHHLLRNAWAERITGE